VLSIEQRWKPQVEWKLDADCLTVKIAQPSKSIHPPDATLAAVWIVDTSTVIIINAARMNCSETRSFESRFSERMRI
jgi:hypothetical protein